MVQSLLHYAAQASSDPAFIGAALLGVLFHVSIQLVEFERFMFHYLAALPVMALGMTAVLSDFGRLAWAQAIVKSIFMETIFNLSFLLSIGVYRMLLHRCRGFPGPVGARLSRFWTAYISGKNLQYYKDLEKMQAKYGDFVRTGIQHDRLRTLHRALCTCKLTDRRAARNYRLSRFSCHRNIRSCIKVAEVNMVRSVRQ